MPSHPNNNNQITCTNIQRTVSSTASTLLPKASLDNQVHHFGLNTERSILAYSCSFEMREINGACCDHTIQLSDMMQLAYGTIVSNAEWAFQQHKFILLHLLGSDPREITVLTPEDTEQPNGSVKLNYPNSINGNSISIWQPVIDVWK